MLRNEEEIRVHVQPNPTHVILKIDSGEQVWPKQKGAWRDVKTLVKVPDNKGMREWDQYLQVQIKVKENGYPDHILLTFERCRKGETKGQVLGWFNISPGATLLLVRGLLNAFAFQNVITGKEEIMRFVSDEVDGFITSLKELEE